MECVSSLTDFYHFPCGKYGFLFFDSWWNRNMLCLSAESWWYKMCSRISGLFIKQQFLLKDNLQIPSLLLVKVVLTISWISRATVTPSFDLSEGHCKFRKRRYSYKYLWAIMGAVLKTLFQSPPPFYSVFLVGFSQLSKVGAASWTL